MFTTFLRRLRALCDETLAAAPATPPVEPPVEPPVQPPVTPPVEPPAPPETPPGSTEPVYHPGMRLLWEDDFSRYATDADLMAAYITQNGERGLHIDKGAGVHGTPAMRIDWEPKAGCTDDGHLIEKAWPNPPREVVISWSVRYSPGAVFDWIGRNGPCHGNARKLAFLYAANDSGRWMVISENHRIGTGSDYTQPLHAPNVGPELTPEELGNGSYHRLTFQVRQSTTPTARDGRILGWVDGTQRWSYDNIASRAEGGWYLWRMPSTFNQGSPVKQSEWIDQIGIWQP